MAFLPPARSIPGCVRTGRLLGLFSLSCSSSFACCRGSWIVMVRKAPASVAQTWFDSIPGTCFSLLLDAPETFLRVS